jgi:exosortase E/protease (VPEID-CTERM system)
MNSHASTTAPPSGPPGSATSTGLAWGWPFRRWLGLFALLLAEGLALAVRFDSAAVSSLARGWWTPVLDLVGSVMPAALVVFVALVLVGWAKAREWTAEGPVARDSPRRSLPYLALHLLGYGALFGLSLALFRPDAARPGILVAAWLTAVLITVGGWLGAMLPPRVLINRLRARAGPFLGAAVLGFLAFGLGRLSQGLWFPLRRVTFSAASTMLQLVTSGSFQDPDHFTFGTDLFAVEIAPQCSGYEGIGLTCAFTLAAFWLFRDRFRFPQAFLLVIPAIFLPWFANVARLVALVLVGTYLSPDLAMGGFHSYAGSILFCAVALGIVAVGLRSPSLSHVQAQAPTGAAAPYLVPFLAMTAAGLLSRSLSTAAGEPLYVLRPVAGVVALVSFRLTYRAIPWRISGVAAAMGAGVGALWFLLDRVLPHPSPGLAPIGLGAAELVMRVTTAVLLVPVIEELAFRGFLARRISSANFDQVSPSRLPWHAIALSSLAFGLLHQRPLSAVIAGLGYGLIYRRTGNLSDAVIAHASTNLVLVLAAAMTGAWDLWR